MPTEENLLGSLGSHSSRLSSSIVVPLILGTMPQLDADLIQSITVGKSFSPRIWGWCASLLTRRDMLLVMLEQTTCEGDDAEVRDLFAVVQVKGDHLDLSNLKIYTAGPSIPCGFLPVQETERLVAQVMNQGNKLLAEKREAQ